MAPSSSSSSSPPNGSSIRIGPDLFAGAARVGGGGVLGAAAGGVLWGEGAGAFLGPVSLANGLAKLLMLFFPVFSPLASVALDSTTEF